MNEFNGIIELIKNKDILPKDGGLYIPNKPDINLFECTIIALDGQQKAKKIREGAILVPKVLKGKGYKHWLELSTFLDLIKHIDYVNINESEVRKIFLVS